MGLPTGQSSFTKCSFMPWNEDGKRQNICAAEVTKAASLNPILRQINLPWSWWGIEHLDRKCGTFTTVFISYRGAKVPPLVGHQEGGGLYRIYSPPYRSWVQRWTYSAKTEGPSAHGGKRVRTELLQSYKAALWAAYQKALETAKALCNDLERLDDEHGERS